MGNTLADWITNHPYHEIRVEYDAVHLRYNITIVNRPTRFGTHFILDRWELESAPFSSIEEGFIKRLDMEVEKIKSYEKKKEEES